MRTLVARPAALSKQLVGELQERIHDGTIRLGTKAATERELCAEFGVSRVLVRQLRVAGVIAAAESARGGGPGDVHSDAKSPD